jgi:hypothetical protein
LHLRLDLLNDLLCLVCAAVREQPALPGEALYDVYVAIPKCEGRKPNTGSAHYLIQHRDGAQEVIVDQSAKAGEWVLLGRFPFSAAGGFVAP